LAGTVLLLEEASRLGREVSFSVRSDGRLIVDAAFTMNEGFAPEILDITTIVQDAWAVAKYLDVHDRVKLTVDHLLLQRERFDLFHKLLEAEPREFKIGGFLQGTQPALEEGKRIVVPIGTEVLLGDYKGLIVVSVWGNTKRTGRERDGMVEFATITSERRMEKAFAVKSDEKPSLSLKAVVHAVAEAYDAYPCMILEQYA
jgi:hypothetical protein